MTATKAGRLTTAALALLSTALLAGCASHQATAIHASTSPAVRVAASGVPNASATATGTAPTDGDVGSPAWLRAAYGVTGGSWTPHPVAIVGSGPYANLSSDLATYRATFPADFPTGCSTAQGGATCLVEKTNPGTPALTDSQATEEELDVETVAAMCSTCPIIVISGYGWDDTRAIAKQYGATVVSDSYGGH